jgi:U3 small nucleolar RNA-associated protein 25
MYLLNRNHSTNVNQNWEHVTHLFSHLNLQPRESHGADFTRVRMFALNKLSPLYRQTLVFSHVAMAEASAVLNRSCHNYMGRVKGVNPVAGGHIGQVLVQVPIVFHRYRFLNFCAWVKM